MKLKIYFLGVLWISFIGLTPVWAQSSNKIAFRLNKQFFSIMPYWSSASSIDMLISYAQYYSNSGGLTLQYQYQTPLFLHTLSLGGDFGIRNNNAPYSFNKSQYTANGDLQYFFNVDVLHSPFIDWYFGIGADVQMHWQRYVFTPKANISDSIIQSYTFDYFLFPIQLPIQTQLAFHFKWSHLQSPEDLYLSLFFYMPALGLETRPAWYFYGYSYSFSNFSNYLDYNAGISFSWFFQNNIFFILKDHLEILHTTLPDVLKGYSDYTNQLYIGIGVCF